MLEAWRPTNLNLNILAAHQTLVNLPYIRPKLVAFKVVIYDPRISRIPEKFINKRPKIIDLYASIYGILDPF